MAVFAKLVDFRIWSVFVFLVVLIEKFMKLESFSLSFKGEDVPKYRQRA